MPSLPLSLRGRRTSERSEAQQRVRERERELCEHRESIKAVSNESSLRERFLRSPIPPGTKSSLDCSFSSSSAAFCRWKDDARDHTAMWRVLYTDRWTGESACMSRVVSRRASLSAPAVAKLWSPWVESGGHCLRFAFRVEGAGHLSLLKHAPG